jgi:hypothetical protein
MLSFLATRDWRMVLACMECLFLTLDYSIPEGRDRQPIGPLPVTVETAILEVPAQTISCKEVKHLTSPATGISRIVVIRPGRGARV